MVNKQYGGFIGTVPTIGQHVGKVLYYVGLGLYYIFRPLLRIWYSKNENGEGNWQIGHFWVYVWYCIKACLYLIIFVFGGPIVIVFGIIYLYSKLYNKMNVRNDEKTK